MIWLDLPKQASRQAYYLLEKEQNMDFFYLSECIMVTQFGSAHRPSAGCL